jgi:hypothetical protein
MAKVLGQDGENKRELSDREREAMSALETIRMMCRAPPTGSFGAMKFSARYEA